MGCHSVTRAESQLSVQSGDYLWPFRNYRILHRNEERLTFQSLCNVVSTASMVQISCSLKKISVVLTLLTTATVYSSGQLITIQFANFDLISIYFTVINNVCKKKVYRYYQISMNMFIWEVSVQLTSQLSLMLLWRSLLLHLQQKHIEGKFKRGGTSCQDEHCCDQLNEVTTPERVKKIYKMVLDDRWLKVHELADIVGTSKCAIYCMLTENLGIRKIVHKMDAAFAHNGTKSVSWGCQVFVSIYNRGWNMSLPARSDTMNLPADVTIFSFLEYLWNKFHSFRFSPL